MPEGDSLYRIAATLQPLVGGRVVALASPLPELADAVARGPGMVVSAVEARGKNLLIWLHGADEATSPGSHAVYSHLRMTGSWHLARSGSDWRKPRSHMRVCIETEAGDASERWQAVCFSAPVVQWLTAFQVRHHPVLSSLGPDLLADEVDFDAIVARLKVNGHRPLGEAIMDQRLVAGIGNVYKSELLFIERLDPFRPVDAFDDDTLRHLMHTARTWMKRNLGTGPRRTRWDHGGKRTWVYDKSGDGCSKCGETIAMRRQGDLGRSTYFCPRCQGVSAKHAPARKRRGRVVVRGPAEG